MDAQNTPPVKRVLEETEPSTDALEQIAKKQKTDEAPIDPAPQVSANEPSVSTENDSSTASTAPVDTATQSRRILHPNPLPLPVSRLGLKPKLPELPPSLELVTGAGATQFNGQGYIGEKEVGIIGYIGPKDIPGVRGVIKQRYVVTSSSFYLFKIAL